MAIIYSYPLNKNIRLLDELVGTTEITVNGQLKTVTRNFLLEDLSSFFISNGGIQKTITLTTNGTSGAATLNQLTGVLNIPRYSGGSGGSQDLQEVTDVGSTTTNSITANSFIKTGGTLSQILAANGDIITAGSNITISGGVISATGGGGGSQNLEQVLDEGNISNINKGIYVYVDYADEGALNGFNSGLDGIGVVGLSDNIGGGVGVYAQSEAGTGVLAFGGTGINGKSIVTYGNGSVGIEVNLGNTNKGLVINSGTSSTGNFIELNKNGVDKFTINQEGEQSIVKIPGGLSTQYLMADGSVTTGGSGNTDLGYTPSPANGIVTSSTGTDATLPLANATNAGLLKPAKFTVLENTSGTNTGDQSINTLTNVAITTLQNNQLLVYETSTGLWKNKDVIINDSDFASAFNAYSSEYVNLSLEGLNELGAFTFRANNTAVTTQGQNLPFKNLTNQTYTGTIVWTGGTAPTTNTQHTYSLSQVGNLVTLTINLSYGVAGASTLTSVGCELPSTAPTPALPTSVSAAGEILNYGSGIISASKQIPSTTAAFCALRIKSTSPNVYEVAISRAAAAYRYAYMTIQYFV